MAELLWRYPGWCNLLRLVFSNHISFSIDTRQWVVRWILLSLKRPFSYISWRIDGVFCADEMRDSCNRTRRPFHISSLSFSKTRYWPAIQWWPHTALARCHFCLKHFMYRCIKSQFRKQRRRSNRKYPMSKCSSQVFLHLAFFAATINYIEEHYTYSFVL